MQSEKFKFRNLKDVASVLDSFVKRNESSNNWASQNEVAMLAAAMSYLVDAVTRLELQTPNTNDSQE